MSALVRLVLIIFAASVAIFACGGSAADDLEAAPVRRVNVILLGATGNLAEKYLWQALYNIHEDGLSGKENVVVWPCATKNSDTSIPILNEILDKNISAKDSTSKQRFLDGHVRGYSQLRSDHQFKELSNVIDQDVKTSGDMEEGRVFYLSVPPKFFGNIAQNIHNSMRPGESGWVRVIIEKPFGIDFQSAEKLMQELHLSLKADEILLVDHYMGKDIMSGLRHFANHHPVNSMASFLDSGLRRIEVGMLETDDCKGRTGFYDDVGVIRDTVQNHLMIMLSLATLGKGVEPAERRKFLERLPAATLDSIQRIGQYASYNEHINEDRSRWNQDLLESASRTPSFIHAMLKIPGQIEGEESSYAWLENVPIHFKSGKALSVRRSYVDLHFKDGSMLIFNLQGPSPYDLSGAFIFVSDTFEEPSFPDGWKVYHHIEMGGYVARPPPSPAAYEVLMRAGLEGEYEKFVSLDEVMEAWRLWSPLLHALNNDSANVPLELYEHNSLIHDDDEEIISTSISESSDEKDEL